MVFGMAHVKMRLDHRVQELFTQYSRQQIQSWIMQGKVRVDGQVITKPGFQITRDAEVLVEHDEPKYVSRAGFKLEKALDYFALDVTGLVALDAGISTGGFTDCLLQRGVEKVYGVDVGYGQVHEKVSRDSRLILLERTNLRTLASVGQLVDLVTLDLSFISVLKVISTVNTVLKPGGTLVVLIKPQFEAQKQDVGRGGIITDPSVHQRVIETVTQGIIAFGYQCKGVIESPLLGGSGNKEFLGYFTRNCV